MGVACIGLPGNGPGLMEMMMMDDIQNVANVQTALMALYGAHSVMAPGGAQKLVADAIRELEEALIRAGAAMWEPE